ncbi:MAG: HAMP domain-containing histidine kinase, partial [Thermoflexales bacterium]|nr:HAMP domain-containing histidine kinase [Thermoflexales bacterium]
TRTEIIGHTTSELNLWANADQRRVMLDMLARDGAVRGLEIEYRKKSGEVGSAVFYAEQITIEGEPCLITMAQDVTAYKQAQVALSHIAVDLQSRNEELDAFSRTVAHDLKNPLGNIIGFSEYLQARPNLSEATRADFINTIVRNAFKMDSIIDELLLLAKVRMGDVPLKPLDMGRIVSEALHRLTFMVSEAGAAIYAPDHWPVAQGYGPWVEEVWVNYLSNAIKYGGQPPHIDLGGELQADNIVRYWVKDDGPGLPPELETQLFQPFPQLSTVRATGHGLGLSIVRQIVEKMGGQVGVDNAPGGCRFWFTLPAAD